MLRALVYIVPVALAVFALIELWRSEPVERADLHPLAWVAVILLLPVIGPLVWIIISRSRRGGARTPAPPPGTSPRPGYRPPGRAGRGRTVPLPPDDDPDFLWRIEQERRRAAREAGGSATPPADTTDTADAADLPQDALPDDDAPEPSDPDDGSDERTP